MFLVLCTLSDTALHLFQVVVVLLFYVQGHVGTVSLPNHTFPGQA